MSRAFRLALWIILPVVLGIALGLGSVRAFIRFAPEVSMVRLGPWTFSPETGGKEASAHLRALIAVRATLALNRSETVYFFARHDSSGAPLKAGCTYVLSGEAPEARWWSITLYGDDTFLIPDPRGRFSVGGSWGIAGSDRRYRVMLGPDAPDLATGGAAPDAPVGLTFRLYRPGPALAADPTKTPLPAITPERPCP